MNIKTMMDKMSNVYEKLWAGNKFFDSLKGETTFQIGCMPCEEGMSTNSFSFGVDKAEILRRVFEIANVKLFKEKFLMACGGSGQEWNRITTLHSSSLCALLFF